MISGSVIDDEGRFRNWYFKDTRTNFRILVNCFESMLRRTISNGLMSRVQLGGLALSQTFDRELLIGSTAMPAVFKVRSGSSYGWFRPV